MLFRSKTLKKHLRPLKESIFSELAQIARACGRVSVGGDPDKRPVTRQEKTGSRSEPANPAKRGTRLKATTDRAFSSLLALQRLAYRRGLSFLPHVRTGAPPIQTMATKPWTARIAGLGWTCPTAQHPTGASWLNGSAQGVQVTDDCMFRFRVSNARGGWQTSTKSTRIGAPIDDARPSKGCRDDRTYHRIFA